MDVYNFECNINIEVCFDKIYLFSKIYEVLGGFFVGISGFILYLMLGGIDSFVAVFNFMKRGLKVSFLFFILLL